MSKSQKKATPATARPQLPSAFALEYLDEASDYHSLFVSDIVCSDIFHQIVEAARADREWLEATGECNPTGEDGHSDDERVAVFALATRSALGLGVPDDKVTTDAYARN